MNSHGMWLIGLCLAFGLAITARGEDPFAADLDAQFYSADDWIYKGADLKVELEYVHRHNSKLELKTIDGVTIKWSEIIQLDPAGLKVMDANGVRRVPFDSLIPEVRKAFEFDPAEAKRFSAAQDREAKNAAQELATETTRRVALEAAAARRQKDMSALVSMQRHASVRVHFVTAEGAAGWPSYARSLTTPTYNALGSVNGNTNQWQFYKEEEATIFVYGLSGVADGESRQTRLIPCGTYTYRSVAGGITTLRAYATSAALALEMLRHKEPESPESPPNPPRG